MGIFKKFSLGLKKTRDAVTVAIDDALSDFDEINDELFDAVEEILVSADVGVNTACEIVKRVRALSKKRHCKEPFQVRNLIQEVIEEMLSGGEELCLETKPSVILVIGVNGAGKTTTIGKLCAGFKKSGKKVIVGAADTFRAAAIEQLEIWTQRAGVEIIKHKEGADPAAVVFDTVNAGKARNADIIICDTAGRLHNKQNLMQELAKIYKVIDRELPDADKEILLVLDATTGQNAVNQAREFGNAAGITGIVLTKLDGTARGGVVLSIKNDLNIPVKLIGVGEQIDDLQPFNARAFAMGLFGTAPSEASEDIDEYESEKAVAEDEFTHGERELSEEIEEQADAASIIGEEAEYESEKPDGSALDKKELKRLAKEEKKLLKQEKKLAKKKNKDKQE